MARINRATCSGSSSWTKCRAPGIRKSSEPERNSWNARATPLFREGSASPKMIRTGRLNSFSLGIICVRERTMGNKSSFRRKKAGRALGVASNCYELTSDIRVSDEPPDLPPIHPAEEPVPQQPRHRPSDPFAQRRGEEPDRLRPPERGHFAVVSVQQHQPGCALGVGQCPVDGRWPEALCATRTTCPSPSWVMTASRSPT